MKSKSYILVYKSLFILYAIMLNTVNLEASKIDDIKSTISNYNNGIIYASKTDKSDHLKQYANEKIVTKFHLWLKSWHDNNLFMDAKIENINFKKVNIADQKALVITNEKWIYKYIDIKTKKVVLPETKINYIVRYELLKHKTKWIIQKIDILSEKKVKK